MNASTRSEINRDTPNVTVFSNQGLAIRQLSYYRRDVSVVAQVRIHLQRYNRADQLISSIDPRLSATYRKNSSITIPNQQQHNTLGGTVLKSENVDAGIRVLFSDVRSQALWNWDNRGTERIFDYDALRRITAVHEKERDKELLCRERFHYGEAGDVEARCNRVGQLIEHLDTAGLRVMPEYNLLGQATREERTFVKAETAVNWTEEDTENAKLLEAQSYVSRSETNALGEMLHQVDGANNLRSTHYTVSGQVHQTSLQLKEGATEILVHNRLYRATGQLQEETLGNGVQLRYDYEVGTQRLKEKHATRLSDDKLLQALQYSYDPVGNILAIEDEEQETEYYKNAKAKSMSQYVYDTLYQLIIANGVESEQASRETSDLPHAIFFGNKDASRLVNYQRVYDYDMGGNLYEIHHQGASTYTQKLTIDTVSNRGIAKRASGPTLQESFDANGNLLYLNIGKPLSWDSRNQLQETIQVEREGPISDKESYLYDGQGVRVQKTRTFLAENQIHTERVRYLNGLELREHWQTDLQGENKQIIEELDLIQTQAGNVPVKVLHWETEPPNAIENDAIYYSLSDQLGSNQIELNQIAEIISFESYYPYGGTAIWSTKNQIESSYKYYRYSGKERDHSGLYYYGARYYMPWLGRWLNPDPSGTADGLNLFWMVHNNPMSFVDLDGMAPAPPDLHPAEKRLRSLLPDILTIAREQVSVTIGILERLEKKDKTIPKNYLEIVNDFTAAKSSLEELRKKYELIQVGLEKITVDNFNIVDMSDSNVDTTAWVTERDIIEFQRGSFDKVRINISYLNAAIYHPMRIPATVVHEMSHLALRTEDYKYATISYNPSPGKKGGYYYYIDTSLAALHQYAGKPGSKPLENADTLAKLAETFYHVSRKGAIVYHPVGKFSARLPSGFAPYLSHREVLPTSISPLELESVKSGFDFDQGKKKKS